jgi:tRNA(fMet)-specific endonuclease VapC
MKVILDTNAYSGLLRGNSEVLEWLESSETVFMSVFVLAELLYGFKGGNKEKHNNEILNGFMSNPKITTIDATLRTSTIFSEIKYFLKKQGAQIPINDIWIAAHTYESGATLITFDNHFKGIPKIKVWDNLGD